MDKRNAFFQIGALLLFLVVSVLVVIFAEGYQYRPDEGLVKKSVVDFHFKLPLATLFIDGEMQKETFPISVRVDPGWHKIRIEKPLFESWEKQVFVDKDNISLWKSLFLVPHKRADLVFVKEVPLANYQILQTSPSHVAVYLKNTRKLYVFDLDKSANRIQQSFITLARAVGDLVDFNDEKAIFRAGKTFSEVDLESGVMVKKAFASGKIPLFEAKVPVTIANASPVGESLQQFSFNKKYQLVLSDQDGENAFALFPVNQKIIFHSEDFLTFAVISKNSLKIFSPKTWLEKPF